MRVGIVGCGNIAGNHVAAFRATPGTEVIACCDVDVGRAAALAGRHGIASAVAAVEALLDLLQWFMGECVEVSAAHPTVKHPIEVEDTAVATLRFASGRAVTGREATTSLAVLIALYASATSGRAEQVLKETYA
jgi:predicted dehydrogenase